MREEWSNPPKAHHVGQPDHETYERDAQEMHVIGDVIW